MPIKGRGEPRPHGEYLVFVSHATADKWLARTLCEKIEAQGARTFRDDRDIEGGDRIPDAIRKKIIQSDEVLVLVTPESADRPWVLLEVGAAWGRRAGARIVAVRCHARVDRIPAIIDANRSYDINELDVYLADVRRRVAQLKRRVMQ